LAFGVSSFETAGNFCASVRCLLFAASCLEYQRVHCIHYILTSSAAAAAAAMSQRKSVSATGIGAMGLDLDEWSDDEAPTFDGPSANDEERGVEQGRPLSTKRKQSEGPTIVTAAEEDEGFDFKERRPDDWMEVKDTIGMRYLGFVLAAQVVGTMCGMGYLSAAYQDVLQWSTSCWGVWNDLQGVSGVASVNFNTHCGWKGYGKDGGFGMMSDISTLTYRSGIATAVMSTFTVLFGLAFSIWTLTVLYKSRQGRRGAEENAAAARQGDLGDGTTCTTCCHRMELAVRSHTLLRAMSSWMIFAGLWLLLTGVLVYYCAIVTEFSEGITVIVESWGSNVRCDAPSTAPRYGFILNGLNVLCQLGAGGFVLLKVSAARRELKEACDLWERDQEEIAALSSKKGLNTAAITGGNSSGSTSSQTTIKGKRQSINKQTPLPSPLTARTSPAGAGSSSGKAAVSPLPSGWEKSGNGVYVNHSLHEVTCITPR
jgi:hypothetical protein